MKKRFLCVLLTLLMLVSLVPSAALPTFAATLSVSESAITVLKQLEGYRQKCNSNGYIGYGTLCTEDGDHGNHTISEKKADAALREVLKDLDKAVNSFASKKGLSLTQGQHDAMVLFSFQNGTAWTTGTGDLQSAIANKATGNGFLNAICWWNSDPSDDSRRMIEANMYLNGVYSSSVPSQYIRVQFMPNGGTMEEAPYQYYDVSTAQTIQLVPTNGRYIFTGWYTAASGGARVTQLTKNSNVQALYAHWQAISDTPGSNAVSYTIVGGDLASQTVYSAPNGTVSDKKLSDLITDAKNYLVNSDYIDSNGVKWARIAGGEYWVKLKVGATGSSVQSGTDNAVYQLFSGGLILGAFFMATDYVTCPVTRRGRVIMGVGCALLLFVIRFYNNGYPEGCSFAILFMNILTPLIDKFTAPRSFGVSKPAAQKSGRKGGAKA